MKLTYINPESPLMEPFRYEGQRYETDIPDTLDLAERAVLSVNALTEPLDSEYDYELYI